MNQKFIGEIREKKRRRRNTRMMIPRNYNEYQSVQLSPFRNKLFIEKFMNNPLTTL